MEKILVVNSNLFRQDMIDKYLSGIKILKCGDLQQSNAFVIGLSNDINDIINCNLKYVLGQNSLNSNASVNFFDLEELENVYSRIANDFINIDKKVLLYLGKFPGFGFDIDGGSILARQLIDTLKYRTQLDLAFIRKNEEEYSDDSVHCVSYYKYLDAFNNKFTRRLENLNTNLSAVTNYEDYDIIITAHVSKFFFPCKMKEDFWNKTILFPMFCTKSYERAGEIVPKDYFELEKEVIKSVKKIITPSIAERDDLINDYNVSNSKIDVIFRGISENIKYRERTNIGETIRLVSIGSIKKQKNNIMQLKILKQLLDSGSDAILHIVTTIQDLQVYEEMKEFISKNDLYTKVCFHFSLPQSELALLLDSCDINISTANWETFGRGIFEGISAGLPTLVSKKLLAVKDIVGENAGVFFLDSVRDFVDCISQLKDNSKYQVASQSVYKIISKVSYKQEQKMLVHSILNT